MSVPFFAPVPVSSGGFVASLIAKVMPGRLHHLNAYNNTAAVVFLMAFDATTVPADGAVPSLLIGAVPANAHLLPIDFSAYGRTFQNGIVLAASSTAATKTAVASALWLDALVS